MMNNQFYGCFQFYASFTRKTVKLNFQAGAVLQGTRKTGFSAVQRGVSSFTGQICTLPEKFYSFTESYGQGVKLAFQSYSFTHSL
jgi:hypothetical protein